MQQRPDRGERSGHADPSLGALLELPDLVEITQDLGVVPRGRVEGGGQDVLLDGVDEVLEVIVLGGGPVGGPQVVKTPAHEIGLAPAGVRVDRLAHLVVEVGEVPLVGTLRGAVEGGEEVGGDLAHGLLGLSLVDSGIVPVANGWAG